MKISQEGWTASISDIAWYWGKDAKGIQPRRVITRVLVLSGPYVGPTLEGSRWLVVGENVG